MLINKSFQKSNIHKVVLEFGLEYQRSDTVQDTKEGSLFVARVVMPNCLLLIPMSDSAVVNASFGVVETLWQFLLSSGS